MTKKLIKVTAVTTIVYAVDMDDNKEYSKDEIKDNMLPYIEDSEYDVEHLDEEFEGIAGVQYKKEIYIDTIEKHELVEDCAFTEVDKKQKAYSAGYQYPYKLKEE